MAGHEKLRAKLETKLAELLRRGEKIEGNLRRSRNPLEQDWSEAAVTLENDEVLEGLEAEIATEVDQIQRAIAAIDAGDYGTCKGCGEAIPIERLEALPHATTCIDCARAAE